MQQLGYVMIEGHPVMVLVRSTKHGVALKLRKGSGAYKFLEDESKHLADFPEKAKQLLAGGVVEC